MFGRSQPSASTFSPRPTASTVISAALATATASATAAAAAASGRQGTQCLPALLASELQPGAQVSLLPCAKVTGGQSSDAARCVMLNAKSFVNEGVPA